MISQDKILLHGGPELDQVDQLIHRLIQEFSADSHREALLHHFSTGGKKLRARLGLAAVQALGGSTHNGVVWGTSCEVLHNATLIHDDLQDGDRLRRGQPTVWFKYGPSQAINAGDSCLMFSSLVLRDLQVGEPIQWKLAQLLSEGTALVVRGQASELELPRFLGDSASLKARYLQCIAEKTSALFEMPVAGAALIAGWSPAEARRLGATVRPLGLLFQMQDDVLDLYGAKGREKPGSDLREGKVSCLVVEHLGLKPQDTEALGRLLQSERDLVEDSEVERWISSFRASGALRSVLVAIRDLEAKVLSNDLLMAAPSLEGIVRDLIRMALAPIDHVFKTDSN